jgi:hypothetical protein
MQEATNTDATRTLPQERPEDVAAILLAAKVPADVRDRLEALRGRSADVLRVVGPKILDLIEEMRGVEAAVNAAFGTVPETWTTRFQGTGLDDAHGVLGVIEDLAAERYQAGELPKILAEMTPASGPVAVPADGGDR